MDSQQTQPTQLDATPGVTSDPSDNTTMTEVIASYEDNGFDSQFSVLSEARLKCNACGSEVAASQFTMHSLRRLEGASDPDDMAAVVATTCPICDAKGIVVLGYGPMAAGEDSDVSIAMQDGRHHAPLPPDASPADVAQTTPDDTDMEQADITNREGPAQP